MPKCRLRRDKSTPGTNLKDPNLMILKFQSRYCLAVTRILALLCTSIAILPDTARADVLTGPVVNPANGNSYYLLESATWIHSQFEARQLGGNLATINDAGEDEWVVNTFRDFGGTTRNLWIGLNDVQVENTFVWSSGEPVAYTNWSPTEPNNANGVEDWVHMTLPWASPVPILDTWNDAPGTALTYGRPSRGIMEVVVPPASFTSVGVGCPGLAGVPLLAAVGSQTPQLGATSHLRVSNLPSSIHVVIVVIGFSDAVNSGPLGSYQLPFDLTPFGLPGCSQFVSDDFTHFLLSLTGQVDWPLTLPPAPGLAGVQLHVQALSDQGGVVALTNAVTAVLGS